MGGKHGIVSASALDKQAALGAWKNREGFLLLPRVFLVNKVQQGETSLSVWAIGIGVGIDSPDGSDSPNRPVY